MEENKDHIMQEPQPDYEKAEIDLLRDALKKDHTGRFNMMTTLMKINLMLRKAKITHKPFKSDKP